MWQFLYVGPEGKVIATLLPKSYSKKEKTSQRMLEGARVIVRKMYTVPAHEWCLAASNSMAS